MFLDNLSGELCLMSWCAFFSLQNHALCARRMYMWRSGVCVCVIMCIHSLAGFCTCVCVWQGYCPQGSSPHQKRWAADQLSPSQLAAWCLLCLFLLLFSLSIHPSRLSRPYPSLPSSALATPCSDFYRPVFCPNYVKLTFLFDWTSQRHHCMIVFFPFVVPHSALGFPRSTLSNMPWLKVNILALSSGSSYLMLY